MSAHGTSVLNPVQETRLITDIGRRYYLEDESKTDIAKDLGLSRFKIARLLEKGRKSGLIRIEIGDTTRNLAEFSEPLALRLGLSFVRVTDVLSPHRNGEEAASAMAATIVREALEPGDTVGFGFSRAMFSVLSQLYDSPPFTAVQLGGVVPGAIGSEKIGNLRRQAETRGIDIHTLSAPIFAGSTERRETWLRGIGKITDLYGELDLALVPIHSWSAPTGDIHTMVPPAEKAKIDETGPVAEMLGHWFTDKGEVVAGDVTKKCLTVEAHHLSAAPHVIAVAAGAHNAQAILAVARSGLITGLVTDKDAAQRMLYIGEERSVHKGGETA